MFEVGVTEEVGAAEVVLDPIRARLLALLVEPHSATSIAAIVGLPRQKVNYHLKTSSPTVWSGWSRSGARAGKPIATYALHGTVRFASAGDRAVFAHELTAAVPALVSRYHDENVPGGRENRVIVAIHPRRRLTGVDDTKES
jgi:hypothetical protein